MRRVLAFEGFDGGSHRAVRERLTAHSRHAWTWYTLPDRGWKWRMRAGALELAIRSAHEEADVLFVASLLDAAHLSAVRGRLGAPYRPIICFMHENQAAYPVRAEAPAIARADIQFALTDLASISAADLVIWNSRWNLQSCRQGLDQLLRPAPDLDRRALLDQAFARSTICWPPVEAPPADLRVHRTPNPGGSGAIRVLWPHRWEHDKGPERLLDLARRDAERLNLRFTLLGASGPAVPDEIRAFLTEFADRIDHAGFAADREVYWRLVGACDWVLSTAHHEFFGIAVAEALLAGCLPWLPEALSYPELVPADLIGRSPDHPPDDVEAAQQRIAEHLRPALPDQATATIDQAIDQAVMAAAGPPLAPPPSQVP